MLLPNLKKLHKLGLRTTEPRLKCTINTRSSVSWLIFDYYSYMVIISCSSNILNLEMVKHTMENGEKAMGIILQLAMSRKVKEKDEF